ncbi:sugar ABC transporter substrate-binding protein, partial [bacterium]|nr:sugar ABC transporter substrate-binding protein [bacterium]
MKSLANEFFSTMAKGAEQHQSEHADEYSLVVNGIKDERDLSRQVALVEEMVASGVDAIVIAPADSKALVPALRRAQKAGVVVINIDNRLDADVLAQEGISIPFVGPDNKAGARKVGEFVAGQLQEGDAVAILEGIRTSFNGQQRTAGFEQAI